MYKLKFADNSSLVSSSDSKVCISTKSPLADNVPKSISEGEKWTQSNSEDNIPITFSALLGALRILAERIICADSPGFRILSPSLSFSIPTIVLVQSIIHITALAVGLILLGDSPQLDLVLYWVCVELIVQIPFTGYFYISLKRNVSFKLEAKRLLKYLLSTVVIFSLIYILLEKYLIYKIELIEFIPSLILFVALGGVAYLIVTYFIDNKIRELFQAIIQEIRKKKDN